MTSPPAVGKRRSLTHMPSIEDQELNLISKEAESRLANSHAVLVEARKIRTNERKLLQEAEHEDDQNGEESASQPAKPTPPASSTTGSVSKRSPSDEVFSTNAPFKLRTQMSQQSSSVDLEERYKRVMMTNAQLDNEKQKLNYEVDLLKERLADNDEMRIELEHQHADLRRILTDTKNVVEELTTKCNSLQEQLCQRDTLIKEHGLMFVAVGEPDANVSKLSQSSALLSIESAQLLTHYEGSLGERLNKFFEDKLALEEENKKLQNELELEKSRSALSHKFPLADATGSTVPCSPSVTLSNESPVLDVETQKNVTEYKLKLKRCEQEITTLQGNVTRLESQVNRYKTSSETAEKSEEELKQEKRRLQKELREAQAHVQDLETKNGHLMKRLEKAKYRNVTDAN